MTPLLDESILRVETIIEKQHLIAEACEKGRIKSIALRKNGFE
jgi:hypothetical protein